ncbi:hypothetical protein RND71_043420 [Anisodus tanguticus]|uniref:CTP synthase n=1 Tax=Anisodus tanguticus TaxID=243964 RepID=A0AAE1UTM2_9SOLA|nr:hypothetical protein RND71_043420 [Anisodus tanguticus]
MIDNKLFNNQTKYILVTGGVISGIGKGILTSSLGVVLKAHGVKLTAIKIDPYINIDAGTFSPFEHGEVFVLDDGGEVDLDLGNYERFLNVKLKKENNITTGKIYNKVISKERKGDYLGKTVQVVPHITDEIQNWIENVSKIPVDENNDKPEVCLIELGGTIGDIEGMAFVEAFRQFQYRVKKNNFCVFHVSLVIQPKSTSEDKTKPTQATVRELRSLGINPDFIICRCEKPILDSTKEKISIFCDVNKENVICLADVSSIYEVPISLLNQNVPQLLFEKLGLAQPKINLDFLKNWNSLIDSQNCTKEVKIVLVGKYTKIEDSYASVIKALQHSSFEIRHKLKLFHVEGTDLEEATKINNLCQYETAWKKVKSAQGLLIPGGFGTRGTDGKIQAIKWAREYKIPFLGVCYGLQLAAIEFARNVLKLEDANSIEINENCKNPIVIDMPEHNQGSLGGTMRLGLRKTIFNTDDSILKKLYGSKDVIEERHRHRFEINFPYVQKFNDAGFRFVGRDESGKRMEIFELKGHQYFVGVQYHPEYLSKPLKPSPPYFGLLKAASEMQIK